MRNKICLIALSIFLTCSVFAQSLNKKDLGSLYSCVGVFLSDTDLGHRNPSPSEFVLCLLDIDSIGRVSRINLIGDEKNKGSMFGSLSKLTVSDFKKFKSDSCKGKTIIMPLINVGNAAAPDLEYINKLKVLYPSKRVVVEKETGAVIEVSALYVNMGYESRI